MGPDSPPRIAPTRVVMTEPGLAMLLFERQFPGIRVTTEADGPEFRLQYERASDGRLTVNRLQLAGSAWGVGSIPEVVGAARVRSGRFRLDYDRVSIDTAEPYLRPSGRSEFHMQDTALELLELDRDAFLLAATEHLRGTGLAARLPTPDTAAPVTKSRGTAWERVTDVATAVALDSDGFESPLIRAGLFDLLVSSMLSTFPLVDDDGRVSGTGPRSAAFRRAISFIEDHLTEPLDTITIAQAVPAPVRTLQSAFRTELGTSVMAHVRARRLAGARQELLKTELDQTVTVSEIARRWGFAHAARFAERYRRAYGENPSDTLRR